MVSFMVFVSSSLDCCLSRSLVPQWIMNVLGEVNVVFSIMDLALVMVGHLM